MSVYIAPFTFDFRIERVLVDDGTTDVACLDLAQAAKEAQETQEGISYKKIANLSGLVDLGPGVAVGITIELLRNWQLEFFPGNYVAKVGGGNLVGGPGGDPIAYVPGIQALLLQSAAATVVTAEGAVPTPEANAVAVWAQLLRPGLPASELQAALYAIARGAAQIPIGAGAYEFRDTDGTILESGTVDANGVRIPAP